MGELILIIAGLSLAILLLIIYRNKFSKRYQAIEYLLKKTQTKKESIKKRNVNISFLNDYMQKANDVGWNVNPHEVVGIAILGMVFGVGFGMFMGNEILAYSGLLMGYFLPKYLLFVITEKRKQSISLQLESAMTSIASAFDVYGNVLDAIKASVPLMEFPISNEFQRVTQEVERGVSLTDALNAMEKRIGKKELIMFNRVAVIAENAGGKAGQILQKCARVVAENRLLKADLETEITQVKQETKIMFLLTIVFLVFFKVSNSEIFTFYKTTPGKILMMVFLVLGVFIVILAGKSARPKELE